MTPLGLYLHIPFCKQKCAYCDFYSLTGSESRMEDYTAALCTHLSQFAPHAAAHTVDTIYFGGGTPSYLGARRLVRLLETIQAQYTIAQDAEITLEANPDSAADVHALEWLRNAGFNRLSLGMQSADDRELRQIGRVHTVKQLYTAVDAARKAGFANLSLDLIYGLPHQTQARWAANLTAAAALQPEHLSCYGLKVEEGTPLYAHRETACLPDDEAQAELYLYTAETLHRLSYQQYEISNFAKPGRASRHNLKYWTLGEYLGFGPGAHSDFGGVRFAWVRDFTKYLQGVEKGDPPLQEHTVISPEERNREWLMLGLRTARGLSPEAFEARFSRPFDLAFLGQCQRAGYAQWEEGRWRLTPRGFLVSNQIISQLLELLE